MPGAKSFVSNDIFSKVEPVGSRLLSGAAGHPAGNRPATLASRRLRAWRASDRHPNLSSPPQPTRVLHPPGCSPMPAPSSSAPVSTGWLALLSFGAAACGGGAEPRIPTTASLSAATVTFTAIGQTTQLTAMITDQHGNTIG